MSKKYKIAGRDIEQLIQPIGGCYASDKITVDGEKVGFMYREEPNFKYDSGWRFMSGTETQEYADNPDNWAIYDVNTIANYDSDIIAHIWLPIGAQLERIKETAEFREVDG